MSGRAARCYAEPMSVRSTALLLVSVSLAASACKDKPADTNATPTATTAAASASAAPAAAKPFKAPFEDSSPAPANVLPTGKAVDAMTLAKFDLPEPAIVPKGALWSSVEAEREGDRKTYLSDGKPGDSSGLMGVDFIDCRSGNVKKYVGKPLSEIGNYGWCFVTLPETFEGNPSYKQDGGDATRVVRAGNVVVVAATFERPSTKGADKWKLAQLDTVMSDMDWATIAKW